MKKFYVLLAIIFSTAVCSNLSAQEVAPPGAGDRDLSDKNIKMRSVDLERVDRDSRKTGTNATATGEDRLAAKYAEIKKDYEQIQLSQDAIIKAYQGSGKVDYTQISKSALEINSGAVRLNSNLFPVVEAVATKDVKTVEKKDEKANKETKPTKSIRDLIVELDNNIGSFATSTMFQNLRSVDATAAQKAKAELEKIIELSAALDAEAKKSAASGK